MSTDLAKKVVEEGSFGEGTTSLRDFMIKNHLAASTFVFPGLDFIIDQTDDEHYFSFEHVQINWRGRKVMTVIGVGSSREEAMEDYKKKIAGCMLIKAFSSRWIECPLFWLPEPAW